MSDILAGACPFPAPVFPLIIAAFEATPGLRLCDTFDDCVDNQKANLLGFQSLLLHKDRVRRL